ncbi:MAG: T9SS C-terminal target domain-containing protein [Deltaproteobacteria bacterium]|nr:T9SS C-terminal target domain-containing protein [Deltaproteobacteria bacterium]
MNFKEIILILVGTWGCIACMAGSFAPAAGQPGSTAIAMPGDPNDTSVFAGWATGVLIDRGLVKISEPSLGDVSHGTPQDALGPAQGQSTVGVVSLGDAGVATLTFENPIANGPGYDFAVFENSFAPNPSEPNIMFLELAFVEVSSDGIHYERFAAASLTQSQTQVPAFGFTSTIDTTDIHNFAGKYSKGYGTPFDLEEIRDVNDLVDVTEITHIRLIDVVGTLQSGYARGDSMGNIINDPWPTDFSTGGFDLDAVGVIHEKTLTADINGDGTIDLQDYAEFGYAYQSNPSLSNWNYKCDVAPFINDQVDINDLLVFFDQWLLTEQWYIE